MNQSRVVRFTLLIGFCCFCRAGHGQVSRADYERALNIQKQYDSLAVNLPEPPQWQESSESFVYRKTVAGGHEFEIVDAAALTRQPAFDHTKLAAALSAASGESFKAATLPFQKFRFAGKDAIEFRVERVRWHCDLQAWTCVRTEARSPDEDEDDDYDFTP
jgi:hypothetical protein